MKFMHQQHVSTTFTYTNSPLNSKQENYTYNHQFSQINQNKYDP